MQAPRVSYIIAAYNAEETVLSAIQAVLVQDSVPVEALVVDDCSSDRTAAVARSVKDDRVRVVTTRSNLGPGGARNVGLDMASGEFIAVLDADDSLRPQRTASLLARISDSSAAIVVDNLKVMDSKTGTTQLGWTNQTFERPSRLDLADFISGNIIYNARIRHYGYLKPLIRRSLIDTIGLRYHEGLMIGEDFYFLANAIAQAGDCLTVPSAGYVYSQGDSSISVDLREVDVRRMRAEDDHFRRTHALDPRAQAALARRTKSLDEALAYMKLRQSIRDRSPLRACSSVASNPAALRRLVKTMGSKIAKTGSLR